MSTEFEVGKRVVIKDKFRATIIGINGKKLEVIRDDQDEPTTVSASVCVKAKGRAPAGIAEKIAPFLKASKKAAPATTKGKKEEKPAKTEKSGKSKIIKKKPKAAPEAEAEAPAKVKNKDKASKKLSKEEKKAAKKAEKSAKKTKKLKKGSSEDGEAAKVSVAKKKNKVKVSKKKLKK